LNLELLSGSNLILRLVIARLAAVRAVVLAVLGKANPVIRLAQRAVLDTSAQLFKLIANQTLKLFVRHSHNERLTFRIETPGCLLSCRARIKSNCGGNKFAL
jgi:hypothetical protein